MDAMLLLDEPLVAKEQAKFAVAKIGANVIRDARIIVSITGEDMQDYLTRLLEPLVARDKEEAFEREREAKEATSPRPKKRTGR